MVLNKNPNKQNTTKSTEDFNQFPDINSIIPVPMGNCGSKQTLRHCRQMTVTRTKAQQLLHIKMMTKPKGLPGFLSHQLVIILEETNESRNVKQSGEQVWSVEVTPLQDLWPLRDKQLMYLQRMLRTTDSQRKSLYLIYITSQK